MLVLTGAGEAFSADMDLKEYFREVGAAPEHVQRKVRRDAALWQWRLLRTYAKPTIAMVNGWCFGGAFTPLVDCDLAIAADEATLLVAKGYVRRRAEPGHGRSATAQSTTSSGRCSATSTPTRRQASAAS